MTTINPNGNGDDFFIKEVRRIMRDQPVYQPDNLGADGTLGTILPGSKPLRLTRPPIVRGSVSITAAAGWTPVYDVLPSIAGQVGVNTDTGELIFFAAPVAGNVAVMYQTSHYSDNEILTALREGLQALYPDIWQPARDTSIILQVNLSEYALPQAFVDMRAVIIKVETNFPAGWTRWQDARNWTRSGANAIRFNSYYQPGTQVRITYNAPYDSLGDVEPECMHLPIYFAANKLLANQETERTRQGDIVALSGQGASAPGTASKLADYWFQRFETEKHRFARPLPIRESVPYYR